MSMHPNSSEHQALHDSATRFLAGLADFARRDSANELAIGALTARCGTSSVTWAGWAS